MKEKALNFFSILIIMGIIPFVGNAQSESFSKRTIASGFNSAWEVVYGPNDSLWVTENVSYKVQRVSIASGVKTTVLNLRSGTGNPGNDPTINFTTGQLPQGGLMGLALHPNLFSLNDSVRNAAPWVYIAYVYNRGSCPGTNTSCIFTTKIVRYDYTGNQLTNPVIVLDNIPGSSDHNSGRLLIGPTIEAGIDSAHAQYRLYYTVGDMGAGQFLNSTRTENAQNVDVMEGKSLRINTRTDGDAGLDAWVPNDNPFYNSTAISPKDYVFTLGHRNPQGLAWGFAKSSPTTNILYSNEQMDRTDDEINILESSKNYGWDKVSGYCDNNVNGYKIGQTLTANEAAFCTVPANNHQEPIFTLFTVAAANMAALYAQSNNALWPTVACSSIEFYGKNVIPGWPNSLLTSPLKKDRIYRVKLNDLGTAVTGDTISYFIGDGNRIRRIMAAPDGLRFYVARDASATVNGGAIMEYTYTGTVLSLETDNIGMNTVTKNLVRIYPNPAQNIINVQSKRGVIKPIKAQLYDMGGRIIKQQSSSQSEFTIDISNCPRGLYLLKLLNGYDLPFQTEKILKQ